MTAVASPRRFREIVDGSLPAKLGMRERARLEVVCIGTEAYDALASFVVGKGWGRAFVLADARTHEAAGRRVQLALETHGVDRTSEILEPEHGDPRPSATDRAAEAVAKAWEASGAPVAVAVGSGTVTDVVKAAATQLDRPWISFATAPSMNGYTSGVAALLVGGVKRTLVSRQTTAVFSDPAALAKAPSDLVAAGFADLCSKPFSNGCWLLAKHLAGGSYCPETVELMEEPFDELVARADGVGRAEPEALALLMEVLLLSGCAMTLAGSSSPASGGEHLISHYWDMVEHAAGRPTRSWHGLQVGVATAIVAELYERIGAIEDLRDAIPSDWGHWPSSADEHVARVRARHAHLPGPIVDEIVHQASQKYVPPEQARARLQKLAQEWPALRQSIMRSVVPADEVRAWLRGAAAEVDAGAFGVDAETLAATVQIARDMRARYTVLDFAAELGILEGFVDTLRSHPPTPAGGEV